MPLPPPRCSAAGRSTGCSDPCPCLPDGDGFAEPPGLFAHRPAADVVRDYLAEIPRLVGASAAFSVLAHIDYPIRYWPEREAGPFDPADFEEKFRHGLRATAESGRALEINTRIPLRSPSSGGGTRKAVRRSRSAATPTSRRPSPAGSPTPGRGAGARLPAGSRSARLLGARGLTFRIQRETDCGVLVVPDGRLKSKSRSSQPFQQHDSRDPDDNGRRSSNGSHISRM